MQVKEENIKALKALDFLNGYENAIMEGRMTDELRKQIIESEVVDGALMKALINQYDSFREERNKKLREIERNFLIAAKQSIATMPKGVSNDTEWLEYIKDFGKVINEFREQAKEISDIEASLFLKQSTILTRYAIERK